MTTSYAILAVHMGNMERIYHACIKCMIYSSVIYKHSNLHIHTHTQKKKNTKTKMIGSSCIKLSLRLREVLYS